jgi:hypothetical protein
LLGERNVFFTETGQSGANSRHATAAVPAERQRREQISQSQETLDSTRPRRLIKYNFFRNGYILIRREEKRREKREEKREETREEEVEKREEKRK